MKTQLPATFGLQSTAFILLTGFILVATAPPLAAQTGWGGALSFDGTNEYAVAPSGAWFGSEFTIETWVYERSYNYWSRVIDFGNGAPSENVLFALSWETTGKACLQVYPSGEYVLTPDPIPLNQWVHLAATLRTNTATLYVNGVTVASATVTGPDLVTRTNNYIGRSNWAPDAYANAVFDELRIWNVARSAEQIREGMCQPMKGTEANLVACYHLDEGTGNVGFDATPHHSNLTLVNSPAWTASTIPPFLRMTTSLPSLYYSSAAWGDYDNDGRLDLLLMGRSSSGPVTQVWRNTGAGFTNINAGLPDAYFGSVAWGDYDNDGWLDILLTGSPGSTGVAQVWRNNRNGTFTDINAGLTGVSGGQAAWGDYDNDGRLDILLTGNAGSPGNIVPVAQVWRNTGSGYVNINAGLTGEYNSSVAGGDYDNDGRLDILLTGWSGGRLYTEVWRNTGAGFTNINAGLPGVQNGSVAWGDYDSDGHLDILLTGSSSSSRIAQVWRNDGNGAFTAINAALPGVAISSAAWGDYDNDGRFDILLAGATGYSPNWNPLSQVWRNTGDGTFTNINAGLPGVQRASVAWGDYDNDGRLDIVLTGDASSSDNNIPVTQLWRNITPNINLPPTAPTGLAARVAGDSLTLSWNPATDDRTPPDGLSYNVRIGSTPGASDVVSPQAAAATGFRQLPALGNAQGGLAALFHLPRGIYYWSVQAVDSAFAGSAFATEQRFVLYPPTAITLSPAGPVSPTGATLRGTVNPRENQTLAWFEYGLTTKYGAVAGITNLGSGLDDVLIENTLTGLLPWMTYHYRVVGSNCVSRTDGPDMVFTLPGPSLAAPVISGLADVSIPQGGSTSVVLSVSDPDTPLEQLVVRARANNPVLLPDVAVGGVGSTRILTLTPDPNQSGSAVITVTASDNTSTATGTFGLTVTPSAEYRSPLLYLTNAQVVSVEAWRFRLLDAGTGSTNYVIEYRPGLSPTNTWVAATNVSDLGGGLFQVDTGPPQPGPGFYRVKGFRILNGGLGSGDLTLDEGAGVAGPVLIFNGPYVGAVNYTWTGSWGTSNGTVQVNGTTAVIPVPLSDNDAIDPLATLTLRLESGPGYTLTGLTQGNITVEENDADWQGTLVVPNGLAAIGTASLTNGSGGFTNVSLPRNDNLLVGFTLRIEQSQGTLQGQIQSDGPGFFPTNALAQLTFTENSFSAVATNVPLPALTGSALFDAPHHLDLRLDAANAPGVTNVTPNQISGTATMVSVVPGRPYLDSAVSGTFLLLKPPVIPATNDVPLYAP